LRLRCSARPVERGTDFSLGSRLQTTKREHRKPQLPNIQGGIRTMNSREGQAAALEAPASILTAIARPSAKEAVVQQIRTAIIQGELKPGQRLTEPRLAGALGVGQATVREALIELEHMGFIQRRKPRKTFVTKLTVEEVEQIYAVRVPLELAVLDMLVADPHRSLAQCEESYRAMREAACQGNVSDYEARDLDFHRGLWAATGNPCLADVLERLVTRLFAFAFMVTHQSHCTVAELMEGTEQHGRILESIRAGDAQTAKQLMTASMGRRWLQNLNA
jgi:DNA-binding GntR family transcriptional regulator